MCIILTEDLQMFVSNKKYICESFSPTWYTGEEKQILAPTYDTKCIILTWCTGEGRKILAPTFDTECITVCIILTLHSDGKTNICTNM